MLGVDYHRGIPLTGNCSGAIAFDVPGMTKAVVINHEKSSLQTSGERLNDRIDTYNSVCLASKAMARYVLSTHLGLVVDPCTTVIELGAGCGLLGLCAASAGSQKVILTDLEEAVPIMTLNTQENGYIESVRVRKLRWGDEGDVLKLTETMSGDLLVLGSDIVWEPKLFQPLLSTLTALSQCSKTNPRITSVKILICNEMRFMIDVPGEFAALAREAGFTVLEEDMELEGLEDRADEISEYEEEAAERWIVLHTFIYKEPSAEYATKEN
jgi:predicted nicotinamide N-methyase